MFFKLCSMKSSSKSAFNSIMDTWKLIADTKTSSDQKIRNCQIRLELNKEYEEIEKEIMVRNTRLL